MGEISRPRLYLSLFSWARWEEKLICVAVSYSGGEADTCDRVEWGRLMGRPERKRESFLLFEGIKRAEEAAAAPHRKEPSERGEPNGSGEVRIMGPPPPARLLLLFS